MVIQLKHPPSFIHEMHLRDRFVEPGKKDKLSEEEMLAKKAEAAQRRRMQVEKATKESEVGVKIA